MGGLGRFFQFFCFPVMFLVSLRPNKGMGYSCIRVTDALVNGIPYKFRTVTGTVKKVERTQRAYGGSLSGAFDCPPTLLSQKKAGAFAPAFVNRECDNWLVVELDSRNRPFSGAAPEINRNVHFISGSCRSS